MITRTFTQQRSDSEAKTASLNATGDFFAYHETRKSNSWLRGEPVRHWYNIYEAGKCVGSGECIEVSYNSWLQKTWPTPKSTLPIKRRKVLTSGVRTSSLTFTKLT